MCNSLVSKCIYSISFSLSGLASALVTGVALIPTVTVAPAVLGVAIGAGVISGAYTGARSLYRLIDRKKHKQKIGLTNSEARSEWLNVGAGAVSVGAAGATQALARAARSGRNISTLARGSVRIVNIAAVSVSASACADDTCSLIYRFYKDGSASKQHAARLLFDLFLLKHSVHNFTMAKQIKSSTGTVNEILSESQTKSFETLCLKTREVCGSAADTISAPIVRSLKNQLRDPRVGMDLFEIIWRKTQNVDISIEDTIKSVIGIISAPIVREYCHEFDVRLNKMINFVGRKLNIDKLSMMLGPLTIWLRDVTFKACNRMLAFVVEWITEVAQSLNLERFLEKLHLKFKRRSAIEHKDLDSFILSKPDNELREAFDDEDQDNENDEQTNTIYCDLHEERKLELVIEEYASEYTDEFLKCSPATDASELREIIVQILYKLTHEEATVFFAVAKQLITDHGGNIQTHLGRFISVDIFIIEIYCLLTDLSCKNNYESLGEYLTKSIDVFKDAAYPTIETEFKQIYVVENDPSMKKIRCASCGGEVFVSK